MFRYTFFIIIFLYSCSCSFAQTKKQLREAVVKANKYNRPIELIIYAPSPKIYQKKLKKVLYKLDRLKLEYKMKVSYLKDRRSFFSLK